MTTPQQPGLSQTRVNLALATLFLGTFALGTAELGVVGMLNLIAEDMTVSISTTGTPARSSRRTRSDWRSEGRSSPH